MSGADAAPEREAELVQRASRGDVASLDALLVQYLPRLRAFVRLRVSATLRDRESCSDLVQSVCREVLEHAGGFEWQGEERFRGWLFKTALNKVRDRARYWGAERRDVGNEVPTVSAPDYFDHYGVLQSPSQVAIAHELAQNMERAFDLLSEDHREVITLSRILGLPHAEVARQMDRGEGAVRMLLSRALLAYVEAMDKVAGRR